MSLRGSSFNPTAGGGGGGVTSFNTRAGAVSLTAGDVNTALTYAPVNPTALAAYALLAGAAFVGPISIAGSGNLLTVAGASTGNPVTLTASGSDTNVGISLAPKAQGSIYAIIDTVAEDNPNGFFVTPSRAVADAINSSFYFTAGIFQDGYAEFGLISAGTNAAPAIICGRSRGTIAAPTKTLAGDVLAIFSASGYTGSQFSNGPGFNFYTDEAGDAGTGPAGQCYGHVSFTATGNAVAAQWGKTGQKTYNPGITAYSDGGANYERATVSWNANVVEIGAEAGGTGTQRALKLIGASTSIANLTSNGFVKTSGGTGALSIDTATYVTSGGALGTPSSGALTNCTGLPAAGVVGTAAILGANTFTALQTHTIGSANVGVIASTGYSITGSGATNMVDLAGTWNTSGNPTALKIAISNTASGATSKFASFLAGASGTTEVFSVDKAGATVIGTGTGVVGLTIGGTGTGAGISLRYVNDSGSPAATFDDGTGSAGTGCSVKIYSFLIVGGLSMHCAPLASQGGRVDLASGVSFGWSSSSSDARNNGKDLILTRAAAATLQHGAADAASPVAQIVQAQGSRSGTDTNVGGANFTIQSGNGTGTGTASAVIIKAPAVVGSGSGAQTMTEIFRATAAVGLTIASGLALKLGNAAVTGLTAGVLSATTNASIVITDSAGQAYRIPCII